MKYVALSLASIVLILILILPASFMAGWAYEHLRGEHYWEEGCMGGIFQASLEEKNLSGKWPAYDLTPFTNYICFKKKFR